MSSAKKNICFIIFLTILLTVFYNYHESLPKPLRAVTSVFATPVAVASGISYYLHLGIPVYESVTAVVLVNVITSICIVLLFQSGYRYFRRVRK